MPLLNRKLITTVLFPLFVLVTQLWVKWANDFEVAYVGVSLAATAIGQMLPFIIDEHLLLSKVFTIKSQTITQEKGFTTTYEIEVAVQAEKISELKNLTTLTFVIVLLLFIFTVVIAFGEKAQVLHNYLGAASVFLSGWYILKA